MSCTAMTDFEKVRVPEGYKGWFRLVMRLFNRVANEKGAERHGEEGVPFENQTWAQIFREDGEAWAWGQITKKKRESTNMMKKGEVSRSINEVLDIAALALMVAMYREGKVLDIWQQDKGDKGFTIVDKAPHNDVVNVRTLDE